MKLSWFSLHPFLTWRWGHSPFPIVETKVLILAFWTVGLVLHDSTTNIRPFPKAVFPFCSGLLVDQEVKLVRLYSLLSCVPFIFVTSIHSYLWVHIHCGNHPLQIFGKAKEAEADVQQIDLIVVCWGCYSQFILFWFGDSKPVMHQVVQQLYCSLWANQNTNFKSTNNVGQPIEWMYVQPRSQYQPDFKHLRLILRKLPRRCTLQGTSLQFSPAQRHTNPFNTAIPQDAGHFITVNVQWSSAGPLVVFVASSPTASSDASLFSAVSSAGEKGASNPPLITLQLSRRSLQASRNQKYSG